MINIKLMEHIETYIKKLKSTNFKIIGYPWRTPYEKKSTVKGTLSLYQSRINLLHQYNLLKLRSLIIFQQHNSNLIATHYITISIECNLGERGPQWSTVQ